MFAIAPDVQLKLIELFSFYGLFYEFSVIGCSQMSVMFNSRVLLVPYSVKML